MPRAKKPRTNICSACKKKKGPQGLTVFRGEPVCEYCLNLTEIEDAQELRLRQEIGIGASSALGWANGMRGGTVPRGGPHQVQQ
jgi:hypothetical protein